MVAIVIAVKQKEHVYDNHPKHKEVTTLEGSVCQWWYIPLSKFNVTMFSAVTFLGLNVWLISI